MHAIFYIISIYINLRKPCSSRYPYPFIFLYYAQKSTVVIKLTILLENMDKLMITCHLLYGLFLFFPNKYYYFRLYLVATIFSMLLNKFKSFIIRFESTSKSYESRLFSLKKIQVEPNLNHHQNISSKVGFCFIKFLLKLCIYKILWWWLIEPYLICF